MTRDNICPFCIFAIPQKNTELGLVDCIHHGYGNACQMQCKDYRENPRLAQLKEKAKAAIREFNQLSETNGSTSAAAKKAAIRSCTLQEAFAAILDIPYDQAAELLRDGAEQP